MRILWIHQNYVNDANAGNCRAELTIKSFLDAGFDIDLICSDRTYFGDKRSSVNQNPNEKLKLHVISTPEAKEGIRDKNNSYLNFSFRTVKYLKNLPKPDIIFCSSPPLPLIFASVWASLYFRARFIIEVRDLWPSLLIEGGLIKSKTLAKFLYFMESLFYRHADHCISVTPGFNTYLLHMGIPGECLSTIPTCENAITNVESDRAAKSWRAANNLEGYFIIIYAGSMNEAYNIQLLLDAARYNYDKEKNIMWVFAGNGREAYKVEHAASEQANIRYLGSIPKKEIHGILCCCDAGLVSHAGWGLLETSICGKLIDYLSASLPVVSLCTGIMEQIIERSGAGYTVPKDVVSISTAVCNLKNLDKTVRLKLGANGKNWVSTYLPYSLVKNEMKNIFIKVNSRPAFAYFKPFKSIAGAVKDVLTRRSEKTLKKYYNDDVRKFTLEESFREWCLHTDKLN